MLKFWLRRAGSVVLPPEQCLRLIVEVHLVLIDWICVDTAARESLGSGSCVGAKEGRPRAQVAAHRQPIFAWPPWICSPPYPDSGRAGRLRGGHDNDYD